MLRHVTQLAAAPVIVDRPGGVVHSERELRIVVPRTGDEKADEAAAVAVEFGVLRGLLDLTSPVVQKVQVGKVNFVFSMRASPPSWAARIGGALAVVDFRSGMLLGWRWCAECRWGRARG